MFYFEVQFYEIAIASYGREAFPRQEDIVEANVGTASTTPRYHFRPRSCPACVCGGNIGDGGEGVAILR